MRWGRHGRLPRRGSADTHGAVSGASAQVAHGGERPTPPGPRLPLILQTLWFQRDPLGLVRRLHERYGPVAVLRIAGQPPVAVVMRPDLAHRALTDSEAFENYSGGDLLAEIIGPSGLIFARGDEHLRQRRRLLAPFHGDQLKRWTEDISAIAMAELRAIPRERPVAVRAAMQRITVDVIVRIVFGVDDPALAVRLRGTIARWSAPSAALPMLFSRLRLDAGRHSPWGRFLRARAELGRLIDEAIEHSRRGGTARSDVLSTLLRHSVDDRREPALTREQIHDELMGLLFAGHDTTASALAWALVMLAHHPMVWRRLVESARQGDTTYADAIGKEVLRLRPSVFGAGRVAVKDTELGGVPIPKGLHVTAMPLGHVDEDSFPEAARFRPERWLERKPPPHASLPFGGGVHRCIGASLAALELRQVLLELTRSTTGLRPAPGRRDRTRSFSVVLIPSRGGRVILGAASRATA